MGICMVLGAHLSQRTPCSSGQTHGFHHSNRSAPGSGSRTFRPLFGAPGSRRGAIEWSGPVWAEGLLISKQPQEEDSALRVLHDL